jgi:hypothetical protein
MLHVQRVLITDDDGSVLSCHEFYGETPEAAEAEFEDHLAASAAMRRAEKEGALIVGDVEEIGEDEIPEADEGDESDDGEDDGDGEIIDAELINEH